MGTKTNDVIGERKHEDTSAKELGWTYEQIQEEELKTWNIPDEAVRREKLQRETCRYPYMAKQMGLFTIDTSSMDIVDVGGGPVGLSSILPCKSRVVVDPLADDYGNYFPNTFHKRGSGEELPFADKSVDLVIITNALDHCERPPSVLTEVTRVLKAGGFLAHYHAINNAQTHPHPAHEWNLNPEWLHRWVDDEFETVWEMAYPDVRYGWVKYNGKVGQPAFCGLYRKVTGY
jgi:SAM-dependent methyltransferase